eukprot:94299_1
MERPCPLHSNNYNTHHHHNVNRLVSTRSRARSRAPSSLRSRSRSRSRNRIIHNPAIHNHNYPHQVPLPPFTISYPIPTAPPPAPILRPQPTPYVLVPVPVPHPTHNTASQSIQLLQQQIHHTIPPVPLPQTQQVQFIQNLNNAIHQNQHHNSHHHHGNHTHLHMYHNGQHIHYVINGVISVEHGGTVTRIYDEHHHNHHEHVHDAPPHHTDHSHDHSIIDYLPTRKVQREEVNEETQCRICMEPYMENDTMMTLPCFHSFHQDCVSIWLNDRLYCPICRHPINHLDFENESNDN